MERPLSDDESGPTTALMVALFVVLGLCVVAAFYIGIETGTDIFFKPAIWGAA